MNKWAKRICRTIDEPYQEIWGNHDGLAIPLGAEEWGVGEALGRGSVCTPLQDYEDSINAGREKVRIFRVIGASEAECIAAAVNWQNEIEGSGYDWFAYPRLAIKALLFDICPRAAGREWPNWCTEGVARSYNDWDPPAIDVFQTKNPTPLTLEQIAGLIPRKPGKVITVAEVTDQIIVPA